MNEGRISDLCMIAYIIHVERISRHMHRTYGLGMSFPLTTMHHHKVEYIVVRGVHYQGLSIHRHFDVSKEIEALQKKHKHSL